MNSQDVFLGRSPEDKEFNEWLVNQRIYDRPHRAEDDESCADDENLRSTSTPATVPTMRWATMLTAAYSVSDACNGSATARATRTGSG